MDTKRKFRKTQHPTKSDLKGQIPVSSLLQKEPTNEFQRKILHCLQSVCKQIFFQLKCLKTYHWITAIKRKWCYVHSCKVYMPFLLCLADAKCQGPHRISMIDSYCLLSYFVFFSSTFHKSSFYMRVDQAGSPELNLILLIHYLHYSSASKIEASKPCSLLLQCQKQKDSRTQAPW